MYNCPDLFSDDEQHQDTLLPKQSSLQEISISRCSGVNWIMLLPQCPQLNKLVIGDDQHAWPPYDNLSPIERYKHLKLLDLLQTKRIPKTLSKLHIYLGDDETFHSIDCLQLVQQFQHNGVIVDRILLRSPLTSPGGRVYKIQPQQPFIRHGLEYFSLDD